MDANLAKLQQLHDEGNILHYPRVMEHRGPDSFAQPQEAEEGLLHRISVPVAHLTLVPN